MVRMGGIKVNKDIFITFNDNLKTSDDDFNIFVENDNNIDKKNNEEKEEDMIEEKITTKEALLAIDKLKIHIS